jgi:hypothetical protein
VAVRAGLCRCTFLFGLFLSIPDAQARLLIPNLPALRPNDRMLHHYRYIAPLLPTDDEGRSPLHYYDSAIQLARQADREPTEREFEVGVGAADEITKMYVHDILSVLMDHSHILSVCLRPERKCSRVRPPTSASFLLLCNWQQMAGSLALVYNCISPRGNQTTRFMP